MWFSVIHRLVSIFIFIHSFSPELVARSDSKNQCTWKFCALNFILRQFKNDHQEFNPLSSVVIVLKCIDQQLCTDTSLVLLYQIEENFEILQSNTKLVSLHHLRTITTLPLWVMKPLSGSNPLCLECWITETSLNFSCHFWNVSCPFNGHF